jgi:lysophospholipase L1-like esterase
MIKSFLISCFSLIVTLFAVELCFRLIPSPKQVSWSDRPKYYYQHELSTTLQDAPYSEKKAQDVFRVAVVGDSFSFAPYMQFDDAFPKKLERMLNLQTREKKAEVINYGVPAFSTSHEVDVVRKAIQEEADLILLQITLNDPEIKAGTPIGITVFDKFGPPKYGSFVKAVVENSKFVAFVASRLHNSKTQREYREYFFDLYENPRSWNQFQKSLAKIAELAKNANKPLVAVVFPLFGLPMDQTYPFYPIHEKVSSALNELNVKHRDISDIYKDIPLERLQVIPGVDRHPNEIGHRMAAEAIYDWLNQQKLLPQTVLINKKFKGRTKIVKEEAFVD